MITAAPVPRSINMSSPVPPSKYTGILTLLPQVLTVFQQYEQVMLGLIMMLVMIFLRDGLLPSLVSLMRGRGE